jgi:hypothetical protein
MRLRRLHVILEEVSRELGQPVDPPYRVAVAAAVIRNPWADAGYVADLSPGIDEVSPELGQLLTPLVVDALAQPVQAYGKGVVVGLNGEVEHGSGLIHTLKFGDHLRSATAGTTMIH